MIYIKVHSTDEGTILAMCDESIINSVLDDGTVFIDIKSYSDFYRGDLVDAKRAKEFIKINEIFSVNAVGKESIKVAIDGAVIDKQSVKTINGVPYAQAFKVDA